MPRSLETKKSRKRKTSSCSDTSLSSPQTLSSFLFHACKIRLVPFHNLFLFLVYSYSSLFSKSPLKFPSTAGINKDKCILYINANCIEFEVQYWAEQKRRKYQNNRLLVSPKSCVYTILCSIFISYVIYMLHVHTIHVTCTHYTCYIYIIYMLRLHSIHVHDIMLHVHNIHVMFTQYTCTRYNVTCT